MSPEVLIRAGIPCCRLIQNAREFVVTFPGAYHSGFSHGCNCGEAANIATPEWLRVAKEATIRRASTNYPPMVSHFQLLYALSMSLCSRMLTSGVCEPRSSRLKDKMKGEADMMVKEIFVENVMETNKLQSILLEKVASCIVLPKNSSSSPLCSNSLARSQLKMKPRFSLGLCSHEEALEASRNFSSSDVMLGKNSRVGQLNSSCPANMSVCDTSTMSDKSDTGASDSLHVENGKENPVHGDGILDKGLLSCVTCGILSFTCVAVVHSSEEAARYLMSSDCGFLNDQNDSKDITDLGNNTNRTLSSWDIVHGSVSSLIYLTWSISKECLRMTLEWYLLCQRTPLHVSPRWIRPRYLRRLNKEGVLLLRGLDSRLSKDLPPDLQKLRCKVAFQALQFSAPIQELSEKLVARMRSKGPYLEIFDGAGTC